METRRRSRSGCKRSVARAASRAGRVCSLEGVTPANSDPGALLAAAHELNDGTLVRLRLTRPSDAALIRDFLETLSDPSRHQRFLTGVEEVPDTVVRHFTYYEPRERLMIAATAFRDGTETIVGLADLAMLETGIAEIALVVADEHQGNGAGRLLSTAVASIAARRGVIHLKATMAADNAAMLRLMEHLGDTVRSLEGETVVAYTRLDPARSTRAA
jgi:acetyltransferase